MIYLFLADGFEETEALVTVDFLRRAGYKVLTVGVGKTNPTGAHGICVSADVSLESVSPNDDLEAVILPGGMPGTLNLKSSSAVKNFVSYAAEHDLLVCAICAAPSVLGEWGLLKNRVATCFPGFEDLLIDAEVCDDLCVISDNTVTGKGAGAVFEFSAAIADLLAWRRGDREFGDCSLSESVKETMQCAR